MKLGQFQEFPVSVGLLPRAASVTFRALQTYSDGTVVRWIDQTTRGQAEPDHPAPVLKLMPGASGSTMAGDGPSAAHPAETKSTAGTSNTAALAVSIIGAVLGVAGLILGAGAFSRSHPTA